MCAELRSLGCDRGWVRSGHACSHSWGQRKCLGGDLGEQVTCDVGFKGQLGNYCLEKLRDESQRFFQCVKSCVYLHTSFLYKKGPTAYISAQGDL